MNAERSRLEDLRIDRTARAPRRSWPAGLAGLLTVLAVGGVLYWWLGRGQSAEVRTLTVFEPPAARQKTLLNASGYVTARREATVSSKITGKIVEVRIEEGMKVEVGQVLAQLDGLNVTASLRLAEAQVQAARAALLETQVRLQEAEHELRRIRELARTHVASPAELDRAEAEAGSLQGRLERQQVEVVVAERQVALWQQQLEDTIIRAPFAGVVTSKNAQPGEMISPVSAGGGFTRTGVCTIVDMESLEIEVDVNESYINRVEPGQPVEAALDAYPDWKIPGQVLAIIPTADRQKATVRVRVGFDQLDPRILPEMGVKVAFRSGPESSEIEPGLVLPAGAIHRLDDRDIVWVLQNGRVERRAVRLGRVRAEGVVVLSGLAPGEKVVVEGPAGLKDGDLAQEARRR